MQSKENVNGTCSATNTNMQTVGQTSPKISVTWHSVAQCTTISVCYEALSSTLAVPGWPDSGHTLAATTTAALANRVPKAWLQHSVHGQAAHVVALHQLVVNAITTATTTNTRHTPWLQILSRCAWMIQTIQRQCMQAASSR